MITSYEKQNEVLHSEFSIKTHKETFVNYLEVVIDKNGIVYYTVPSHQEILIQIACRNLNISREELYNLCPEEYHCDFLVWLLKITGYCIVWNNLSSAYEYTSKQIDKLKELKNEGLFTGIIPE